MPRGEIARSIARGAFYLALEKSAALLSGVAYLALLLRWLGPTKYGIITLAMAFVGFATMATLNFEVFLERYAAEYEARGMLRTLRHSLLVSLGLKLALGLAASLVIVGVAPWLAVYFRTPELEVLLPILVLIVAFDAFATTGRATLFGVQQYRWVSGVSVLFHVAKTVMVGLLWWTRQGLPQLAVGLTALTIVQGVVFIAIPLWLLRHAEDRPGADGPPRRDLFRAMLAYCTPLLGARMTFMSGQNLGKIVLGKLFDTTHLGYFAYAFQIVERFVELTNAIASAMLPTLTQLVVRGEHHRLRMVFDESLRLIQVTSCAVVFVLFAFARELTLVVASPLFEQAVPLLQILALVPLFRSAQQPLTMMFQALRLPGAVLRLAMLRFVGEFGSYFALVPLVGLAGACWSNLVGVLVSYAGALALLHPRLEGGTTERVRTQFRAFALVLPLLLIALVSDAALGHVGGLVLRLGLIPIGWIGIFALGLVTHDDLERVSAMPLQAPSMRAARDALVRFVDRFVRSIRPWRAL